MDCTIVRPAAAPAGGLIAADNSIVAATTAGGEIHPDATSLNALIWQAST